MWASVSPCLVDVEEQATEAGAYTRPRFSST